MSHSVHPYSFRVGILRDWKSRWFQSKNFAKFLKEAGIDSELFWYACTLLDDTRTFPLIVADMFVAPGEVKGNTLLADAWRGGYGDLEAYARISEHLVQRLRASERTTSTPIVVVGIYSLHDTRWGRYIQRLLDAGAHEYFELGFGIDIPEFVGKIQGYLQK